MSENAVTTLTYTGTLVLFSSLKGFGIIRQHDYPLDGGPQPNTDIFIHKNVFHAYPDPVIRGATLEVDCVEVQNRLRATQIISVQNPKIPNLPWHEIEMKWFSAQRGYGFGVIAGTPDQDVFIHADVLRKAGNYVPDMRLMVQTVTTPKGLNAITAMAMVDARAQ